jgi:dGTPase
VLHFEDLPRAEIDLLGSTGSERIETLVRDLLRHSEEAADIVQGEEVGSAMLRLREFMFERVYLGPVAQADRPRIEHMLRALFDHYAEELGDEQRVVDWLAGMTDRYAIREFEKLPVSPGS